MSDLTITRPRLVRDWQGSRFRCLIHVARPRDLIGDELDTLWERFNVPHGAAFAARRGRVRRRRIVFTAHWETRI